MLTAKLNTARSVATSRVAGKVREGVSSVKLNPRHASVLKPVSIGSTDAGRCSNWQRTNLHLSWNLAASVNNADSLMLGHWTSTIKTARPKPAIEVIPSKEGSRIGERTKPHSSSYALTVTESTPMKQHGRNSAKDSEIEEKYCEIAAKRLSQEVFQF